MVSCIEPSTELYTWKGPANETLQIEYPYDMKWEIFNEGPDDARQSELLL